MYPNPAIVSRLCLAFIAMANVAFADGASIVLRGNDRGTPACTTCHGARGEGMPANGFPRLAGLNAGYLQAQLEAFAAGRRVNAMMTPVAQTLSSGERAAVARYYADSIRPSGATRSAPLVNSTGARLATQGRWSQGLPACTQCHGAMGVGVGATFPALTGQSALYIENQLRAWQRGTRPAGPLGLMQVIASKLSGDDVREVAEYFSGLAANKSSAGQTP